MMNSKEVALMFDLPIDTIRYYERVGVIPPITRDKNGYRIYAKRDLNNWATETSSVIGMFSVSLVFLLRQRAVSPSSFNTVYTSLM